MVDYDTVLLWGAVLLLILAAVLTYLGVSGWFRHIDVWVGVPPLGDCVMMYKYSTGSYRNIGTAAKKVHELAPKCEIINLCYDDPRQVAEDRLRWTCGAIVSRGTQSPDPETKTLLESHGYKEFSVPAAQRAVISTFPLATSISCLVACMRVYCKMAKFNDKHHLDPDVCITVYGSSANAFIWPVGSASDKAYIVPECAEDYQ